MRAWRPLRRFLLHLRARVPQGADALGRRGEREAVKALRREGYRVLARRLSTRGGEVDVLAVDGETLVLVEVKASLSATSFPRTRVDHRKRARLREAYRALARSPSLSRMPRRLDVVTVSFEGGRARCTVLKAFARL